MGMDQHEEVIDVRSLMAAKSLEEHCRLAEEYFARLNDWTHHLSKPFGSFDETPQLLVNLAVVLQGLQLCPGMTVLEFGAGTCWVARILTQLGCKVIAVDVSPTALRMGQELFLRHPGQVLTRNFRNLGMCRLGRRRTAFGAGTGTVRRRLLGAELIA